MLLLVTLAQHREALPLVLPDAASLDERLRAELAALAGYRTPSGGLAYWAGESTPEPALTARAIAVMAAARSAGFEPPADLMDGARRWLAGWLDGPAKAKRRAVRLLAIEWLASAGQDPSRWLDEVQRDEPGDTPSELLLRLSVLSRRADEATAAAELERRLRNHVVFESDRASFEPARPQSWGDCWCGWWNADAAHLTARYLAALSRLKPADPLLSLLARDLAWRMREPGRLNTFVTAESLAALLEDFVAHGDARPGTAGALTAGARALLAARFDQVQAPPAQFAAQGEALAAIFAGGGPARLTVQREGGGRLYYTVRYTQDSESQRALALVRGFELEREYLPLNGEAPIQELKAGGEYRVRLTVRTAQGRGEVALEDPLPAGLEVVDPGLATSAQASASVERNASFTRTEYHPDRVRLFTRVLPPGTHHFVYRVRAITPARFVAPPAQVEEMYRPELFGRTGGGEVMVLPEPADAPHR